MIDLVRARVRTQLSVSRIFNPAVRTRRRRAVVRRCPRAAPRSVVARARRCAVLDHGQSRARMLIRRALGARPRVHRGSARNPQRHAGAGSARPTRCRGAAHRAWRCDPARPRPAAVRRPTRSPIRSASMSSMSLIPGPDTWRLGSESLRGRGFGVGSLLLRRRRSGSSHRSRCPPFQRSRLGRSHFRRIRSERLRLWRAGY